MATVVLKDLRKSFRALDTINGIDLTVEHGEFCEFVGPSGRGKSTLLRIIAGLETATSGGLEIDGIDVNNAEPADRGIAMVFQSYALYPHLTVRETIGFGLSLAKRPKSEMENPGPLVVRGSGDTDASLGSNCLAIATGRQSPSL